MQLHLLPCNIAACLCQCGEKMAHLTPHPSHKGSTFSPACLMQVLGQSLSAMCSWFIRSQEHCSTYGDHFRGCVGRMTYDHRNICIKKNKKTYNRLTQNIFTTLATVFFSNLKNFRHDGFKNVPVYACVQSLAAVEFKFIYLSSILQGINWHLGKFTSCKLDVRWRLTTCLCLNRESSWLA